MSKRSHLELVVFITVLVEASLVFAQEVASSLDKKQGQQPVRYEAEVGLPKDQAAEKRRDYALLEAALNDLISPKNPEHKYFIQNGGPGREIVIDDNTIKYVIELEDESSNIDNRDPRKIPADIREDFKRRNAGRPGSLKDFKPANPNIIIRDLDRMFEEGDDPLEQFRKTYPTAWGFVWAYQPAYSKDGKTALIVFEGGPNGIHGLNWVYLLTRKSQRWEVEWRHCRPRE